MCFITRNAKTLTDTGHWTKEKFLLRHITQAQSSQSKLKCLLLVILWNFLNAGHADSKWFTERSSLYLIDFVDRFRIVYCTADT